MMKEKCSVCNKKLNLIETITKCGDCDKFVCTNHRHFTLHKCIEIKTKKENLIKVVADKIVDRL